MRVRRFRAQHLALAVITFLVVSTGIWLAPAQAVNQCGHTEQEFVTKPNCTMTGIIKAPGRMLTREDLLTNLDVFQQYGFTEEFIRTAPERKITVRPGMTWSGCNNNGADGRCRPDQGEIIAGHQLTNLFEEGTEITVIGDERGWIALMCGNFLPVNTVPAEVRKTEFRALTAPAKVDVGQDMVVTVRSTVVSDGPFSPTRVQDTVSVAGQSPDCTVTPAKYDVSADLAAGAPYTFDRDFTVRCTQPSNHFVKFTNKLTPQPGVRDPDPNNNTREFQHAFEVFGHSNFAVTAASLDCPTDGKVATNFRCTGKATVKNEGPFGPARTSVTLTPGAPADCTVTPAGATGNQLLTIPAGETREAVRAWDVRCTKRSHHPIALNAKASVAMEHVLDDNYADDSATANDSVGVFEDVDLVAAVDEIRCDKPLHLSNVTSCSVTVTVTNKGPATAVITEADLAYRVENGCTAEPSTVPRREFTLNAGQSQTFTTQLKFCCDSLYKKTLRAVVDVRNSPKDPHAVDSDHKEGLWVPSLVKPVTIPSTGLPLPTPVFILATPQFDPLTQVDVASLRAGARGNEQSITGCLSTGVDINHDGLPDLACNADTSRTAVNCSTDMLRMTGRLKDGTPFFSQRELLVLGCLPGMS